MNKEKQGKKLRFNLKSNPIMGVLIPLIFIMLVTQIFNHNFLTGANLSSILKSIPFLALATLGASFPLLIGEIDISVGRIAGLCGMFFSLLFVVYNLPLPVSILCALALGLVIGFVNAFLVVKIGMSSFIATMGTLYICGSSIRVPCAPLFACAANVPSVEAMAASTASGGTVGGSMRRVSAPSCGEATTSALSSSRNSPTIAATPSAFRTAKPSPALRAFSMTHMRIISAAARRVKCRNSVRNGFQRYWRLFQKKAGQMRRPLL